MVWKLTLAALPQPTGANIGLEATADSSQNINRAVEATSSSTLGTNTGVWALADGANAATKANFGVLGIAHYSSGNNYGVYGSVECFTIGAPVGIRCSRQCQVQMCKLCC